MGVARPVWSVRGAARLALCLVLMLCNVSASSAVAPEKKSEAHHSHHAAKAKLREEVAAAERTSRERYESKVAALEQSSETLRREAEETVLALSKERNELTRNITRYKKGLQHLNAKRKTETETLRVETEALKKESAELQLKLEEALDVALKATKAANEAREESRAAKRNAAAKNSGKYTETAENVHERVSVTAHLFGALSGCYDMLHASVTRLLQTLHPFNLIRELSIYVLLKGWLPLGTNASVDDAVAFVTSVVVSVGIGAATGKGPVVLDFIGKKARTTMNIKGTPSHRVKGTPVNSILSTPDSAWRQNSLFDDGDKSSDSESFELVDGTDNETWLVSPTKVAVIDASNAFDSSPDAFEKSLSSEGSELDVTGIEAETVVTETETETPHLPSGVLVRIQRFEGGTKTTPVVPKTKSTEHFVVGQTPGTRIAATAVSFTPAPVGKQSRDPNPEKPETSATSPGSFDSPIIADGALKSALKKLAAALATPNTNAKQASKPSVKQWTVSAEKENVTTTKPSSPLIFNLDALGHEPSGLFFTEKKSKSISSKSPYASSNLKLKRATGVLVHTPMPFNQSHGGRTPGSGDSASSVDGKNSKNKNSSQKRANTLVTPRDRMVAYSQKLRRGVDLELPALDTPTPVWGGDNAKAGGVRHPKGWAS